MRTFIDTPDDHGRNGYGLGLERYVLPGGLELIGHMGTGAGYRTLMFHLPAQHIDFTLALNRPGDPTPVLAPVLELLLAAASYDTAPVAVRSRRVRSRADTAAGGPRPGLRRRADRHDRRGQLVFASA